MKRPIDDIERLISRNLDGECSADERRRLNAGLRDDPEARALYEEYSVIDREAGGALRAALGGSAPTTMRMPLWQRASRFVAVAAAACLAVLIWVSPPGGDSSSTRKPDIHAGATSWFSPLPTAGDTLIDTPSYLARQRTDSQASQRRFVVVPSDTPGEFLVIEVDQNPARAVPIQEDF